MVCNLCTKSLILWTSTAVHFNCRLYLRDKCCKSSPLDLYSSCMVLGIKDHSCRIQSVQLLPTYSSVIVINKRASQPQRHTVNSMFCMSYHIALYSRLFPPTKGRDYQAIHARTFTLVGHKLPSLAAMTSTSSSSVVYHFKNAGVI